MKVRKYVATWPFAMMFFSRQFIVSIMKKLNIKCFDISKEYQLINSFTATAELGFGLLLMLIRKIDIATQATKKGLWEREKYTGTQFRS